MGTTLECWVYGQAVNRRFYVIVPEAETVINLKQRITDVASVSFHGVEPHSLNLYSISDEQDSDQLERVLKEWRPEGKPCLNLRSRVSDLRECIVIVQGPHMTLSCWVRGQGPNNVFPVEISNTKTVGTLKKAIREEKPVDFHDVDADALILYSIPSPSDADLETILKQWNPTGKNRLNSRTKLSALGDETRLLIVVDAPSGPPAMAPLIAVPDMTLNCWVRGQGFNNVFSVKISSTETISILKEAIKEKAPELTAVAAKDIALYKVSLPCNQDIENVLRSLTLLPEQLLPPVLTLSNAFPDAPVQGHVHIIVDAPSSLLPTHAPPLSAIHRHMQYILDWTCNPSKSPSEQGDPSHFKALQSTSRKIEWRRPPANSSALPATLLHQVFGQFVDDCHEYAPTSEDNSLVLELSSQMSYFFENERQRQEAISGILREHGIMMVPSSFSGYTTDGDLHVNGRRYVILEVKNEVGSKGAEPYCQAVIYYVEGIKDEVKKYLENKVRFNFPCLIMTHFGPHLSFSGAVWAGRFNYQVLSTALPLFWHPTDTKMRESAARHIGAFRNACQTLNGLYEKFDASPTDFMDFQLEFPHPRCYTRSDGQGRKDFQYIRVLEEGKLLFVVETDTGDKLCVKFVRKYSVDVHQKCADLGIAPQLRGHDDVPGGWQMIVMDLLEGHKCLHDVKSSLSYQDKERVKGELRAMLTQLHQNGLVHGDVRDANLMLMITEDGLEWKLVDFDWSGKVGEVRYPMNVNRGLDLRRPDGAIDGELILEKHDIEMVDYLF